MSFILSAEFTIFPDDYPLGPSFLLSGMKFNDANGARVSFVNDTTKSIRGLQFDTGISIVLPVATSWAQLLIGEFPDPVTIEEIDSAGAVMSSTTINKPGSYSFVTLVSSGLKTIRLVSGPNETSIVSVWMLVP